MTCDDSDDVQDSRERVVQDIEDQLDALRDESIFADGAPDDPSSLNEGASGDRTLDELVDEMGELRREHPSGWLYLFTRHDAIPILVDSLLDLPPGSEFDETELAEHAGVTRQTVSDCTDLLIEVDLIEEIPGTSAYRVADSDVVRALHELNSALNNAGDET